jgi:membrane associated rhomboid family serine protease
MIIVPTEKQLDWRNAPVVLFALVLINLMVFFLYQSGDNRKVFEAIVKYQTAGYLEQEWPFFEKYLEEKKETHLLKDYREQFKDKDVEAIVFDLLGRDDFFIYLKDKAYQYFPSEIYDVWIIERTEIDRLFNSLSFVENGLIANDLNISSFLTHQFLHGDIMHLMGNMFFLVVCGFAVEAAIGHWRFLLFYLLSGLAAGLAQVASDWNSSQPLVGASGAISGVMAMYLAVFRLKKIEFFYWIFFFVGYLRAPALLILPFYLGKEIYSYYHDTESNIAFMAHAGGFGMGAVLIGLTWVFNRSVFNQNYIEQDQTLDPGREKLAEIYNYIDKHRFDRALHCVNELIQSQGVDFDSAMLRYNLLKIGRGAGYTDAALGLLTGNFTQNDIKKLDKVWQENPDIQNQVPEQAAIKLGMQLVNLENLKSAEEIFLQLQKNNSKNPRLGIYATKLATAFQRLKDREKATHYEFLASQLSQGAANGLL